MSERIPAHSAELFRFILMNAYSSVRRIFKTGRHDVCIQMCACQDCDMHTLIHFKRKEKLNMIRCFVFTH